MRDCDSRRHRFTSLVLVRKGAAIPAIPEELSGYVRVERVQGLNTHDIPFKHFDEWLIVNAKAGFTGRGSLRLQDKKGNIKTWISGVDMQNIIGVDGSGTLKRNHRICFESGCGHRAIYDGEYYDESLQCKVVIFKCVKCGAVKHFPKRPIKRNSRQHKNPSKNYPPKTNRSSARQYILAGNN